MGIGLLGGSPAQRNNASATADQKYWKSALGLMAIIGAVQLLRAAAVREVLED